MQIKVLAKMAKNDDDLTVVCRANSLEENRRMLEELGDKLQMERRSKEDLKRLFNKLNHNCQTKSIKDEEHPNFSWYNKNVINCTYGPIPGFPSGSWWGIRMDCSRDRVHVPFNEDVQNGPYGVTSICTSNLNVKEDVDFGNSLTLTGQTYTKDRSGEPLLKNYENRVPVRLVRSYNLLNEFAPKTGYRYDGLYVVTNYWIGINSDDTRYYKFALIRLHDQESPPWNSKQTSVSPRKSIGSTRVPQKSLRNCTKCTSHGGYEFRKYSHDSTNNCKTYNREKMRANSKLLDVENVEQRSSVTESAIVTRHVFKKTGNNPESTNAPSTSMTDNKSFLNIGNQSSKAHSTNISIRTGLYDSSHVVQQDTKKNCQSFCRTSKITNIFKTTPHIENLNLSNRDRIKDTKETTMKIPAKLQHVDCPQSKASVSILRPSSDTKTANILERNTSNDVSSHLYVNSSNGSDTSKMKYSSRMPTDNSNTTTSIRTDYSNVKHESSNVNTYKNHENNPENDIVKLGSNLREQESCVQGLKSLDSLDSLTPDKILHLINKQKYHPLSKLLMGNMIGLTSEQSIALKSHESTTNLETSERVEKSGKDDVVGKKSFKSTGDELIGVRCYKFRRRKRLPRKIATKDLAGKCNKLTKDTEQYDVLTRSTKLLGSYEGKDSRSYVSQPGTSKRDVSYPNKHDRTVTDKNFEQKETKDSKVFRVNKTRGVKKQMENELRSHLRSVKGLKPSVKKHIQKKQRREIANLSIDAKIGPKIRGPRNRRLRCISNVYAKRTHESFSTAICTLNKCKSIGKVNARHKRIREKRARNVNTRNESLDLRRTRSNKNLNDVSTERKYKRIVGKPRVVKKQLVEDNTSRIDENVNNERTSKSIKSTDVRRDLRANETMLNKGRKRKLIETSAQVNCNGMQEYSHEGSVRKPCTMDAVTQCCLISEELVARTSYGEHTDNLTSEDQRNEERACVKIEYNESDDMKAESYETIISEDDENYAGYQRTYNSYKYSEDNSTCEAEYSKGTSKVLVYDRAFICTDDPGRSSSERISAFVPVNALDSDLRIARLRSIGFRPITSNPRDDEVSLQTDNEKVSSISCSSSGTSTSSNLVKQDVAEKYNKYTNEDNTVVVYMDEELQYQDIEDEDEVSIPKRYKAARYLAVNSPLVKEHLKWESTEKTESSEQELEPPWHGWKKVVTNKDSYWIGW